MNIKDLPKIAALLAVLQAATIPIVQAEETILTNAQRVANDRTVHAFKINIATMAKDQVIATATAARTEALTAARATHTQLLSESNARVEDLRNHRNQKRIWDNAKKRRDMVYNSYNNALTLVNQATRKMNSERTCVFFCPNTDEFEVAKAVRARYWTYMSSLKAKYNILKTEVVPTTLEEETDKAIRHRTWTIQDKERVVAANTYLRNMLLTSEYYPNAAVLFNTAKREFDWAVSVTVYNTEENRRTSEVTIENILAIDEKAADDFLAAAITDADDRLVYGTKDFKKALSDAIKYAAVVVEETLDSPWVTDQSTFNYRLDCALEDSLAVAVVFHGANHKDKLILDDSGLYKYPFDINASFPAMSKMCIPIVVPKSGINTLVADDGTIEVYRNWWMTTGEVDDTGIIVREEEEEINEFIELLKLAKEVAKKPVYIMYGNGYNDKDYEGDKETVIRVIDKLTKLNELDLIAGTLYSDIETGGFTMYTLDGDVISTHQGLNK
jgi:hypothetical protein